MYLPGETIWFKVYLFNKGIPDSITTNVYVSLLNERGGPVVQKLVPMIDAVGDGTIALPDSISANMLTLVAYTAAIQNDTELIYYKPVSIITKSKQLMVTAQPASLRFFAEAGSFINGVANKIAFKAVLQNGLPFDVKAVIKDNGGSVIDSISATHDGMGSFTITPQENEKYYAEWIDNKNELRRTYLPVSITKGITLHTEQVSNYLYYILQNPVADSPLHKIHIIASLHQKAIYSATIDMSNLPVASGRIPITKLPPGILQITAYDDHHEPIAERVSFINLQKISFAATLAIKEQHLSKRGKNTIEINVPDTLVSNLSLAIYDADFSTAEHANTIFADLLLEGDIKGYVNNPAWYFSDSSAEKAKALDLVLLTNGWRRYLPGKPATPAENENYITLAGTVTNQKKIPQAIQPVTLLLLQKDSSRQFFTVTTDSLGRFKKEGLIFFDTATIWYQFDKKNKKATELKLNLDPSFVNLKQLNSKSSILETSIAAKHDSISGLPKQLLKQSTLDGFTNKGYKLADVTVKTRKWKNDPLLLMDEKYTSGIFRGGSNAFAFDILNDPGAYVKGDILNYLISKVPGLSLDYPKGGKGGGIKRLFFRNTAVTRIYINDNPLPVDPADGTAYTDVQNLNINDIAYVKWYDMYPLYPSDPALAIYLKKGDEISAKDLEGGLPKINIQGYATTKEFYAPDYGIPDNKRPALDQRTTIYWQPYIITGKTNHTATISFYTNDISSNLFLVLEGMNEAGKLVYIEKYISEKK